MNFYDLEIMARTIYGEARGEGLDGKIAVGYVIRNRANDPKWWGGNIVEVCKKPYQFSCWLRNDPNYEKLTTVTLDDEAFYACVKAALHVAGDACPDITQGATHYHAHYVEPSWASTMEHLVDIGNHKFYKEA